MTSYKNFVYQICTLSMKSALVIISSSINIVYYVRVLCFCLRPPTLATGLGSVNDLQVWCAGRWLLAQWPPPDEEGDAPGGGQIALRRTVFCFSMRVHACTM